MRKIWMVVVTVGLIISVGLNIIQFKNRQKTTSGIEVLGVLDGDTVTLLGKTRFRLRNIDAPEMGNCGGEEAKKELERIIGHNRVRVEEEILDNWGRPMGYLYIGETLVNKEMLKTGWVRYHTDNTSGSKEMKQIEDENKLKRVGVYSQRCYQMENTENPKCNIKGNIDPSNNKLKRYYFPGCVQYKTAIVEKDRGEQWFCSEEEAKSAGYVRSERCPK